jgi:hypothetical protein
MRRGAAKKVRTASAVPLDAFENEDESRDMLPTHLPRAITDEEAAVILAIVATTPGPAPFDVEASLREAVVTGESNCGCPSISLGPRDPKQYCCAQAWGRTPSGRSLLLFVFATAGRITELEVADTSGACTLELPVVDSIEATHFVPVEEVGTHPATIRGADTTGE